MTQSSNKFCTKCGNRIGNMDRFCGNCGLEVVFERSSDIEPTNDGLRSEISELRTKYRKIGFDRTTVIIGLVLVILGIITCTVLNSNGTPTNQKETSSVIPDATAKPTSTPGPTDTPQIIKLFSDSGNEWEEWILDYTDFPDGWKVKRSENGLIGSENNDFTDEKYSIEWIVFDSVLAAENTFLLHKNNAEASAESRGLSGYQVKNNFYTIGTFKEYYWAAETDPITWKAVSQYKNVIILTETSGIYNWDPFKGTSWHDEFLLEQLLKQYSKLIKFNFNR